MPIQIPKREGGCHISSVHEFCAGANTSAASLIFRPGDRPDVEEVRALSAATSTFSISLEPPLHGLHGQGTAVGARWLELLMNGLTFDLQGLQPGESLPLPSRGHVYSLPLNLPDEPLEVVNVQPGPHISAGGRMLPVIRGTALLAARLSALPRVQAVVWHPARTWSSPQHFRDLVFRWADGGAFPGLGLTALSPTPDGGLQSEGLALFTGQELRLDRGLLVDRALGARLALRLLHWLVENGKLSEEARLTGPSGEPLLLTPSVNGRYVDAWLA